MGTISKLGDISINLYVFLIVPSNLVPISGYRMYNFQTGVVHFSSSCQFYVENFCLKNHLLFTYRKVPKFLDTRKLCDYYPKTGKKRFYHRLMHPKDADGIANSEDPDQTAPLGAV